MPHCQVVPEMNKLCDAYTLPQLTGTDTVNQGRQVSQNGQGQGRHHHKQGGINGCAGPAVDLTENWKK